MHYAKYQYNVFICFSSDVLIVSVSPSLTNNALFFRLQKRFSQYTEEFCSKRVQIGETINNFRNQVYTLYDYIVSSSIIQGCSKTIRTI